MAIYDSICFDRNDYILELPILNSEVPTDTEVFVLDCNVSVGFFYRFICIYNKIEQSKDDIETLNLLKDLAVDVLNLDHAKQITAYDVETKFDNLSLLRSLYTLAKVICSNLGNAKLFSVPDIHLDKEPAPSAVEKALAEYSDEQELMEGIVYVTIQTHNSYQDVINMPFTVFQAFLKHIKIHNNISIPEWREKYLKEKYKEKLKEINKDQTNSHKKTTPDINGLRKLGGLLNG